MSKKKGRRQREAEAAARGDDGSGAPERGARRTRRRRGSAGESADSGPAIPSWLPATVFLALTAYLFRGFIFSDAMLYGGDTLSLGYQARAWYADAVAELGRIPRWQPMILGGTPFVEALSAGDSFYPPSLLLLLLLEPYRALGWKLVLHVAAAGFFMFGWARTLGASRAAALVAGAGYMIAPYFVSFVHPGHDGKMFVTALAPLVFMAVERHFVRPRLATFTSIALVVALVIYTTHFQMAYFLFGGVGLYAIFRAVQLWRAAGGAGAPSGPVDPEGVDDPPGAGDDAEREADPAAAAGGGARRLAPAGTRFGLFLAAAVTGAGIAGFQFFPAVDYVTEASRRIATTRAEAGESGVAWSSSWSMHPEEAMTLVVPEFVGNNSGGWRGQERSYWGRNAFKDNSEYVGLVLMLLALLSFVGGARRGVRFFFLGLGGTALLFALGTHTPLWRLFYEVVPGIRLFRVPAQAMLLFTFSVATLAALGVDRILKPRGDDASETRLLQVMGGALGLLVVLALAAASGVLASAWSSIVWSDVDPGRLQLFESIAPLVTTGAWIAVLLAAGVVGLVWAHRAGKAPAAVLVGGLVALVAVDELRVSTQFVVPIDHARFAEPDPNIQRMMELEEGSNEPYRLLSLRDRGQDVEPMLHGVELAAGHHPNDLARYRELIGMVGSGDPVHLMDYNAIRRLLNVRYILWPDYARGQVYEGDGIVGRLQLQDGTPYETMISMAALPRARLVGSAVVKSDEEAVPYMLSDAFDPEREVVLPEAPAGPLVNGPVQGAVRWLERGPDRLRLAVSSDQPALLVVADNWYPDWHATVDGAEAPVLRAYHSLRAVPVPAGDSEVEMWYASDVVRASAWISFALLLGLLAANGVVWWRGRARGEERS